MSEEKKDNGQIAQSVSGFLDKYGEKLWKGVKSVYKAAANEARVNWRIGYETYLNNALRKYSTAKPFLSANRPTPLKEFYVPLGVTCDRTVINETSIKDLTETNKFAVIMASAGSGKSMLMQHLFVDTLKQTHLVPVFVELRDLNNTELTLFDLIKKKLRDNGFDFNDEYINVAIKAGHFAFFFDGFDEVAYDKREKITKEIQDLSKFDQNYFVLSSRFDDSLNGWKLFDVWKVQPLTLELACRLIEKRPEDKELKDKFIKALKKELFERHKSFLSNPLLLSIMLITYKDRASIPEKLSIFYDYAYAALYDRHDAQKSYRREILSRLNIQDFRKVFAAFCFSSYNKQQFSFSDTEIYDYLEKAHKLTSIDFDKKAFLEDLIQGVCLLVRDGLEITFAHRSFQEYFTAIHVTQLNNQEKQARFIEKYFNADGLYDTTKQTLAFFLIYEIAPVIVERLFFIPKITLFEQKINFQGEIHCFNYSDFLKTFIKEFWFGTSNSEFRGSVILEPTYRTFIDLYIFVIENLGHLVDFEFGSYSDFSTYCDEFLDEINFLSTQVSVQIYRFELHIEEFLRYKRLVSQIKHSNYVFSFKSLTKVVEIKELLIKKHQEQEAYLDAELED